MDGFVQTYKQIQSFGHSTLPQGYDLPNKLEFPRWSANGVFPNILGSTKISTQYDFDESLSTFGSLAGSLKWIGSVVYNEFIYLIPFSSTSIGKIDTKTDTVTTFGSFAGSFKWAGGVLAPNGFIYGIPRDSGTILKINPRNDTATTFGSVGALGDQWYGGVLAPDGIIYCSSYAGTKILKINTNNDFISVINLEVLGVPATGTALGACIGVTGDVYFIPSNNNSFGGILKLRIKDQSISVITIATGGNAWQGGVLAPNGSIYCIPNNATQVLKINTYNDQLTLFGSVGAGISKWSGGVLGPNGYIYGVPRTDTAVLRIDTVNDTASTFGTVTSPSYFGGSLAPNGSIYCCPLTATNVLKIGTPQVQELHYNFTQSRYFNML